MSGSYDVVVVGAGIHGVGVAQAAAAAGHRSLVLEQAEIAGGTSSRSSKLIHGGLRYLEHAELGLVRECLQERAFLLEFAPELVALKPFYIPIYRDTRRRPWQLRAGLSLYAFLGGLGTAARFRTLPRTDWGALDGLSTQGLDAVFQYWDGQTDDKALTHAVLRSAQDLGAELLLPAEFLRGELHEEGVDLLVRTNGIERSYRTRTLVNCAGPWVHGIVERLEPMPHAVPIDLVQGTHLLLDAPAPAGIYYLEVPADGRGIFRMPWRGKTLVGTTETPFEGRDPAKVVPLPAERDYLKQVLGHYFPELPLIEIDAFAGLRVLPRGEARPFDRGRELILGADRPSRPRVLSLYGGKLTSYRADAAKVLRRLESSLPAGTPRVDTRRLRLRPV
jgi:glycerol-3-phosphate dehydrogenase